jgi:hypothetical protein
MSPQKIEPNDPKFYEDTFNSLKTACETGDLAILSVLLPLLQQCSPDLELDLKRLLNSAAKSLQLATTEKLLNFMSVLQIPVVSVSPITMVAYFASSDDANTVATLIELIVVFAHHGWDINTDTPNHGTILTASLQKPLKTTRLLQFLISLNADLNMETRRDSANIRNIHRRFGQPSSTRPLDVAAGRCSVVEVCTLIEAGARLDLSNPLHAAAARDESEASDAVAILDFLVNEKGCDINQIEHLPADSIHAHAGPFGTPLMYAAIEGNVEVVKWLLANGADKAIQGTCDSGDASQWVKNWMHGEWDNSEILRLLNDV